MDGKNLIFDTRVDTNKIYVSVKTKFVPRNYVDKDDKSPVYLHITGDGKRIRLNLDIYIDLKKWNPKQQRLKEITQRDKDLNLILDNIEATVTNIKTVYRLSELKLTPLKLREELINDMPRVNFCTFFDKMLEIEKVHLRIGTYKRYKAVLEKLKKFQPELFFHEINDDWFSKFKTHLKKEGNLETTISGNLKAIKKFLKIAIKSGIKIPIALDEIKIGTTLGNRTALNPTELKKIFRFFNSEFINPTYQLILGYFLFSCMSGLRYSDLMALSRPDKDADDIDFLTVKTSKEQIICLNKAAKEILEKCPELFKTKLTNAYLNRELKDIMNIIGIKKKVSMHVARHTFATTYLRMGGKVEKLRILLGHSDIKQTMIYEHIVAAEANESIFLLDKIFD